jgi:glycosyltransferase involved in cell wall biosynthesis
MKTKVLTLWSPPYCGGAARRFVELVDGLSSRGTDVVLLSVHGYAGQSSVCVERLALPQGRFRGLRTHLSGEYLKRVGHIVQKHKPDVVFTFGLLNGAILFHSARLSGIPCVLFIRGLELVPREYRRLPFHRVPVLGTIVHGLYAGAFRAYARGVFHKTETVVFQHEAQYQAYLDRRLLRRTSTCSIHLLPNNSNPSWLPEGLTHQFVREPVTVVAANLYWDKGFRIALDAFEMVREHVPSARLVILGDGPHGNAIRQYAARIPGVSFHGHVGNVYEYFRHARLLLHPTLHELGSPNIVLEAAGSGFPMLVSEEVAHTVGMRSWVYPSRDHKALTRIWIDALTKDEVYDRLCRESHELGERHRFDWVGKAQDILVSQLNGGREGRHRLRLSDDETVVRQQFLVEDTMH